MALPCDYDISRCAISQYGLLEHTCGPPTYKFTLGVDAFVSKSTRNHNTFSWRVCGGYEFICRQDAKKVADQSQKCALVRNRNRSSGLFNLYRVSIDFRSVSIDATLLAPSK